jgi:ABC-type multidrug transport system fused ATPase/permease subunit
LLRFIDDNRKLWRIWLPALVLATLAPIIAISIPLVEKRLIDKVVLAQRLDLLPRTAVLYGGLWFASTRVLICGGLLRSYFGERLTLDLRQRLFAHSESLSVAFSRQEHSGRTMSLFVNDVPTLSGLFSTTVLSGVGGGVAIIAGGVVMFRLNPALALVAAVMPVVVGIGAAIITRPLRPASRKAQEKAAELNERLQETLTGIREVVTFGREAVQANQFRTTLGELLRLRMRVSIIESSIGVGASLFSLVATLTIFIYGSYLVIQSQTTLGTVIAMQSLFGLVFRPAGQMIGLFSSSQKALGAADRVYAFLDEEPMVDSGGDERLTAVRGRVEFEHVDFSYRTGERVLSDVSFVAHPGDVIALVGPSGAGKTTIASLMGRFYDPEGGAILLDGIDLRDLQLDDLRSAVGFVFQDSFLFAESIRENIAFGRQDASDAEIEAAARAANAWEFIERLPHGMATKVGERGVQFSEGQKQRIAIARALLRDPRVLILDEPTSALDARSEHVLQAAFENLMQGRTTFVIAHRLATVQRADNILVIDAGRIVEQGTHLELMQRHGLYRELFELQFSASLDEKDQKQPISLDASPAALVAMDD